MTSRRIAAIYLPQLPCELAAVVKRPDAKVSLSQVSFGVVLVEPNATGDSNQRLAAVSEAARRHGIFEGQTLEEARAIHAAFVVRELPEAALMLGLERIVDSLRDFDLTVACEPPSTVWLDITGVAHLLGGEAALARELVERMRLLGHRARVAIAGGPRLSQVFAHAASFGGQPTLVIDAQQTQAQLDVLPTVALPLERDAVTWLTRLGVITLGDLRQLPRTQLLARLGASAERWIELASGIDHEPLTLYPLAPTLTESFDWEEPTSAIEALTFALRRLTVRLEARLRGRGVAAERVQVLVKHDMATARHRGAPPVTEFALKLPVPLWHEDELRKVILTRLERTPLPAPSVGLQLCVTHLSAAIGKQLELSRLVAGFSGAGAPGDEQGLPVLLSELTTDVGAANVGVLTLVDSFLPEKQGFLVGLTPTETSRGSHDTRSRRGARTARGTRTTRNDRARDAASPSDLLARAPQTAPLRKARGRARIPTRLFPRPLPVAVAHRRAGAIEETELHQASSLLRIGTTVIVDRELYVIERLRFDHRLNNVEWWSERPVSRDYLWLMLAGAVGKLEAFAYIDRDSGRVFVQGVRD
jgi:protein ImuB